jgi:hypothetical protein
MHGVSIIHFLYIYLVNAAEDENFKLRETEKNKCLSRKTAKYFKSMQFLILKLRNQIYEKQIIRLSFFRSHFAAAFIISTNRSVVN